MSEIENIANKIEGEIPFSKYDILRVVNIEFPEEILNNFKAFITIFLVNKRLDPEDKKWEELLPERFIKFTNQLTEHDYSNDDLISNIISIIDMLQNFKDWTWFSSNLNDSGFEIYFEGVFRGTFLNIIHHLGVPHENMYIIRDKIEYPTYAIRDVLTYRKWNHETMILESGNYKNG